MSEADLQDLTSIAHEPSSLGIRKSDSPVAAHFGQLEPSATFVGSPGRSSGGEVRPRLGSNHNGTVVGMGVFLVGFFILMVVMAIAADIGETENGSINGRLFRKSPRLAAI